jgi:hypothetical protein
MKRISVSQIGSYLAYLNGHISLDKFVDGIKHKTPPSIKMRAGTIFHCAIQDIPCEQDERIIFTDEDIQEAKLKVDYRSEIFEYKIRKKFPTEYGEIFVTGVADQIVGNVVHEFKTTYSAFSYERYAESIQWMAYCNLFGVEEVRYQVWQISEPDEDCALEKIKPLKVKSYNEFSLYANRCTDNKFLEAVHGFAQLINILRLDDYFEPQKDVLLAI